MTRRLRGLVVVVVEEARERKEGGGEFGVCCCVEWRLLSSVSWAFTWWRWLDVSIVGCEWRLETGHCRQREKDMRTRSYRPDMVPVDQDEVSIEKLMNGKDRR